MLMLGSILGAVGGIASAFLGRNDAKRQEANQREFAQNGIRWKVEDAKRAGIHPLYALGANTTSYSPVSVGTDLGSVGQNIGRAMDATRTGSERINAYTKTVQELQLKRMGLENELLASQIANVRQSGGNPPFPGDPYMLEGQPSSGPAKNVGVMGQETAAVPETGFSMKMIDGVRTYIPIPAQEFKDRTEDNWFHEVAHALRNNFIPSINAKYRDPPKIKLAPWQYWAWENGGYVIKNHQWRNRKTSYNYGAGGSY